ncbi:MAG: protein BatD, partial [Rikenellaceae bacterium]|nr:protein BatD [Rikenellaceae bacterium]
MRSKILLVLFLIFPTFLAAQNVQFEANVPSMVAAGNVFKVEFTVNKRPERFLPPDLSQFSVIAGPSQSTGSFTQNINGVV